MKQNEMSYHVTMVMFAQLLKDGLLTPEEYAVMDTKMQEKSLLMSLNESGINTTPTVSVTARAFRDLDLPS